MGRREFSRCTRIALFDYGDKISAYEAGVQRAAFIRYIQEARPYIVLIIPTPSAQMGEMSTSVKGTHVWNALHAPDSLQAMRGSLFKLENGTFVRPLFPMARRVKELQRWAMANWMKDAGSARPLFVKRSTWDVQEIPDALSAMRGRPLALDLEFIPSKGLVTAIGISDGRAAVSVPWDSFYPTGSSRKHPGLAEKTEGTDLKTEIVRNLQNLLAAPTPKYAHNFVADVPRLERMGHRVGGPILDTFAAHAIAFPELAHGLQTAAASMLDVQPWKSLYKPKSKKHLTRDDEEFWTCDPQKLFDYNCKDAYHTWHLAQRILPWVEIDPMSGERLR